MGNIGGNLGMWLGLSCMDLVGLVAFIKAKFFKRENKRCEKKKRTKTGGYQKQNDV